MSGQGQAPANAMQQYPQQTMQQARFMPSPFNMNQPMGSFGFNPMAGFNSMGFNPMGFNSMAKGSSGGYGYSAPQSEFARPDDATVTTTQAEQTPGYVTAAPTTTVTYTEQPKPFLQGGSAAFASPIQLSSRQMRGKELVTGSPFAFNAPTNVSMRAGFGQELQSLQNQYLTTPKNLYKSSGKLDRNAVRQYNQQFAALSTNQDYQKAVRELMQREGLGGLLGA
jgi:hypothetical protein